MKADGQNASAWTCELHDSAIAVEAQTVTFAKSYRYTNWGRRLLPKPFFRFHKAATQCRSRESARSEYLHIRGVLQTVFGAQAEASYGLLLGAYPKRAVDRLRGPAEACYRKRPLEKKVNNSVTLPVTQRLPFKIRRQYTKAQPEGELDGWMGGCGL